MEPKNSPQPQYKLPTLAQEAQIQKSKDIKLERENIFDNAFAQNAKTPTVWDNMYTQGINFQPTSKGGVNLERYIDRDEFKTLGFNPFIDNESYYQSNTGFWDDFAAARKGQWDLFKIGLFSHYGTSDQYEKAQRYERAANIGTSQRTNTASRVFNNAVLNSGYTLGLMTGIVAEEIALGFLTAGAGNLAKIPSTALRITDKINDASTIIKALERGKDVGKMRQIWDATKATTGNIGKAIVPFGNTADMILNWSRLGVKVGDDAYQLLDAGAKTTQLFGTFYRDTREILMAHDESKLEAAMLYNTMMDQMLLDYQSKNNFNLPTEKDVEAFHQIARYQQDRSYWKNMMLIYASNRISFGNIFNKFNPRILRVGEKSLFQNKAGKVVADWSGKNVRQVLDEGFLNATTMLKESKHFFKNFRHSWKYIPKVIAKGTVKYGRANIGEGFQEIGQEIINHAEENIGISGYNKYMQGVRGGFIDDALYSTKFLDGYRESAAHFVSAEGAEIFSTGFLMGGIAGPYMYFAGKTTDASTWQTIASYRSKTTRAEKKAELKKAKEQLDKAQEKFTNLSSKEQEHIYKYVLDISRQAGRARLLDEANEDKNAKKFFDVKDETVAEYITESLNYGTFDVFVENVEDLLQLSEGELADAFKEQLNFEDANELAGIKQRAQDIIGSAKSIKKAYDNADSIFPELLAFTEEEKEKYKGIDLDAIRTVRNEYISMFVVNQHKLQRNLERVAKIHDSLLGKDSPFNNTKEIPLTAISSLFSEKSMETEIEMLESEIDTLKQTITSQKEADPEENKGAKIILAKSEAALNTAEGKLKRMTELNNAFSNFTNRSRYLSLLETLQKALKSKEPGLIIGNQINFKRTEDKQINNYLGTIIDAKVNENGDVITTVRYMPKDGTSDIETTINISNETNKTIEELEIDTNSEGLKLSEETEKMLRAYIQDVAKNSNTTIDPLKFDKFAQDLLDAKILKSEETDLAEMINMLMNPNLYVEITKQLIDRRIANQKNLKFVVKEDLNQYFKALNKNNLLQELIDSQNLFIRGKDLAAIIDNFYIPREGEITFYDAKTLEIIDIENARYQAGLNIIKEYVENLQEVEEETAVTEEETEEAATEKTPAEEAEEEIVYTFDSLNKFKTLPKEFQDYVKEKIKDHNERAQKAKLPLIDINNLNALTEQQKTYLEEVIAEYKPSKVETKSSKKQTAQPQDAKAKKADIERRRQEELNKLKENLENDLKEAEKEPDTAPKVKIKKVDGSIDTNSIRQNSIEAANSLYKYGVNRINAKYNAELDAVEEAVSEEFEVPTEGEGVLDNYKKLGLPITEINGTQKLTGPTKALLQKTDTGTVILSQGDLAGIIGKEDTSQFYSKEDSEEVLPDQVIYDKANNKIYFIEYKTILENKDKAIDALQSMQYPSKPEGEFTEAYEIDENNIVYLDKGTFNFLTTDKPGVYVTATVMQAQPVESTKTDQNVTNFVQSTLDTIDNVRSIKELDELASELIESIADFTIENNLDISYAQELYKDNIETAIAAKRESLKASVTPQDFVLNGAYKYENKVYLVMGINAKSVRFADAKDVKGNTITVKQKDLWKAEAIKPEDMPEKQPVTPEEQARYAEAKKNNIDINTIFDSLSEESISSESEFTEDFANKLTPKCD